MCACIYFSPLHCLILFLDFYAYEYLTHIFMECVGISSGQCKRSFYRPNLGSKTDICRRLILSLHCPPPLRPTPSFSSSLNNHPCTI